MITLLVDFNDIDDDGNVVGLGRLAARRPVVGDRAHLKDEEGSRCWGTITRVTETLAFVDPDWDTWTTSSQRKQEPQGWWAYAGAPVGLAEGSSAGIIGATVESNDADAPMRFALPPLTPTG